MLGLVLLPGALGIGQAVWANLRQEWASCFFFLSGLFCYTMLYPVLRKPLSSYVWGHELTHVLGIWLARGRIHGFKAGAKGGMVKADKSNLWIRLLPYFFPIYTISILALYMILSLIWNLDRYYNLLVFFLGLSWGFHLWMTQHILRQNQPDIRYSGVVFSLVIIIALNLFILGLLLVFVSPELTLGGFGVSCLNQVKSDYCWLINKTKLCLR